MVSGLLDHDAQMLELHAVNQNSNRNDYKTTTIRKIDCNIIKDFKDKLSSKLWQNVFENDNNDVNSIFNSFLNTYLDILFLFSQNNSQQDNIK